MSRKAWRRSGIALSIVWFLAAGYAVNSAGLHRGDFAMTQYRACLINSPNPGNASGGCLEQFTRNYTTAIRGHFRDGLLAGILPILAAWGLAYGLAGTRRRRASQAA